MERWVSVGCRILVLAIFVFVARMSGASGADVEFHFGVGSAGVWGRYVFRDARTVRSGWITPRNGQESFEISGLPTDTAGHLRTIVYVPGCAIQTYDIPVEKPGRYSKNFECQAVPRLEITGQIPPYRSPINTVPILSFKYDHPIQIEAKFVASWAAAFFRLNDGTSTQIPIGNAATLDERGIFHMLVPDLRAVVGGGPLGSEEAIRFLVRDQVTGQIVDQLRISSPGFQTAHFADLPLDLLRPEGVRLMFLTANQAQDCGHDQYGFAHRMLDNNVCEP
jgi:hypothetical protein